MHMAWLSYVGGRLAEAITAIQQRPRVQYFPAATPVPAEQMQRLAPHADTILGARAAYPDADDWLTSTTLISCPQDLRKAHQAPDRSRR